MIHFRRLTALLASAALMLTLLPSAALAKEADITDEPIIIDPDAEGRHTGSPGASWCELRFQPNGGTPVEAVFARYDTAFDLSEFATEREDYTFTGWYLEKDLFTRADSIILLNDTTLYAGWQPNFEPDPEPIVDPGNPFADVALDAYYHDPVVWAIANGITGGTDSTTFSPYAPCTRAQVVTFLWRLSGSPEPAASAPRFPDVPAGAYYESAARWAAEKGIAAGTSDGRFDPAGTVTRAQVVTFLWRLNGSPDPGAGNPFKDVSPSAYYFNAMLWALEHSVTGGTGKDTFSPYAPCTRAQTITLLFRSTFC